MNALKQEERQPLSLSELRKVLTAAKTRGEFNRLWIAHQYDRELINGRSVVDKENLKTLREGILERFAEKQKFESERKIAHDSQSQAIRISNGQDNPPQSIPDDTLTTNQSQGETIMSESAEVYQIPAEVEYDRREAKVGSDFAENLETKEVTVFSPFEIEPADFKGSLDRRSENRGTLIRWIRSNLIENIDFGCIHIVSKDKCKLGKDCKNKFHYSKPLLFKPGAEKICGLVGLRAEYPAIAEYERRAIDGGKIDVIILRCLLYSGDRIVAEGTGSRLVSKDYGDINKSIKMAEKSGQIDAIMRCAGLSEIFSQEDSIEKEETETEAAKVDAKAEVSKLQALKNKLNEATHELHLQNIWIKHNPEIKALSESDRKSLIALKDVLKVSLAAKAQRAEKAKAPSEPERITARQLERIQEILKSGGTGNEFLTELEVENLRNFANDPYSGKSEAEAYIAKTLALIGERKNDLTFDELNKESESDTEAD